MRRRTALAGLFALLVSSISPVGGDGQALAAAKKAAVAAGTAELAEGLKSYDAGRFEEALAPLEKAWELGAQASALRTLGHCHRQLGRWERAAFYYGRYLANAPRPVADEAEVRALLSEMQLKADVERRQAPQIEVAQPATAPVEPPAVPATALPAQPQPVPQAPAAEADKGGIATRWWFWTAIGGVVVAGAVTAAVLATQDGKPSTTLGQLEWPKP